MLDKKNYRGNRRREKEREILREKIIVFELKEIVCDCKFLIIILFFVDVCFW